MPTSLDIISNFVTANGPDGLAAAISSAAAAFECDGGVLGEETPTGFLVREASLDSPHPRGALVDSSALPPIPPPTDSVFRGERHDGHYLGVHLRDASSRGALLFFAGRRSHSAEEVALLHLIGQVVCRVCAAPIADPGEDALLALRFGSIAAVNSGRLDLFGEEQLRLFGFGPEDVPADRQRWIHERIHPTDRERVESALALLESGAKSRMNETFRVDTKHRGFRAYRATVNVLASDAERPRRYVGAIRDVSEEYATCTRLQRINAELETSLRTLSHDLAAPMRHASAAARFLVEDYGDRLDDTAQHYLDLMSSAVERGAAMARDLSRLAPRSERTKDLGIESLPTRALLAQAIEECIAWHGGRGVELVVDCELETIDASRPFLTQAIVNLLSNAIKYGADEPAVHIRVVATPHGSAWEVHDNGSGIPEAEREQVFRPFYRRRAHAAVDGQGLGLSIVKKSIDLHGGTISVSKSDSLAGTCVRFELPHAAA